MRWQMLAGRKKATKYSGMGKEYLSIIANQYRNKNLANTTPAECKFEEIIKRLGLQYFPQKIFIIKERFFISDFYFPQYKLSVEIDGFSHFTKKGFKYDLKRMSQIKSKYGVKFLRFSNNEVMNNPDYVIYRMGKFIDIFESIDRDVITQEYRRIAGSLK